MPLTQLAIFSADSCPPALGDLAGMLLGPAECARMGGTARVQARVDAAWRVHALAAEFLRRDLRMSWREQRRGFLVRTAYTSALVTLDPPGMLDGWRLRLWFLTAGTISLESREIAVVLGLGRSERSARRALATLGLDGEVIRGRDNGTAIKIDGVAKLARMRDLMGEHPPAVPDGAWV